MAPGVSLDNLWNTAPVSTRVFSDHDTASIPEAAQRYLRHAIRPGTPLASAVRLRMHGEIRLGRWLPFRAEQVLRRHGDMLWTATVHPAGVPLFSGFDRFIDGAGAMRWKLFGIVPFIDATGPDVSRSAIGRVQQETIWLPSAWRDDRTTWVSVDDSRVLATAPVGVNTSGVELGIDPSGRLNTIRGARWGSPPPDTKRFRLEEFGGVVEDERVFGGYTIPSRVRVGWYFGSPQFDAVGEFFRVTIDGAVFR